MQPSTGTGATYRPPRAWKALGMLCCRDPSADFALAWVQANAAPLVLEESATAAMLSNRLDIGSPPFCENRHMPCGDCSRREQGSANAPLQRLPAPYSRFANAVACCIVRAKLVAASSG